MPIKAASCQAFGIRHRGIPLLVCMQCEFTLPIHIHTIAKPLNSLLQSHVTRAYDERIDKQKMPSTVVALSTGVVALSTGVYLLAWIVLWVYRWRNPRCSGKLPPGSMGLPLLGETLQFFRPSAILEGFPFVRERVERYGPVFKTSLVGQPAVVLTDPELCHSIFQQEGKLFQLWYPYTFRKIFGRQNMSITQGVIHKYVKCLAFKLFGIENIKGQLIHDAVEMACKTLSSWAEQPTVELKDATEALIFHLTAKKLISYDMSETSDDLRENFSAFFKGLITFPINLPGTAYYKCMQGRKKAMKLLKSMLKERRSCPGGRDSSDRRTDFFDLIIEEMTKENSMLTEDLALDLMLLLLFASYETTSTALTMAIKLLTDHPDVLEELTVENEEIIKRREDPSSKLTWDEYRSMTFTSQVINETVRLANIAPIMFRKAMTDVQIEGYTIPAGWSVIVCPAAVHLNPDIYKDPLAFNPWRWKNDGASNPAYKYFMAFGGGIKFCAGADFSKMQMAVFLHYLVTKYRWRVVNGGEIIRTPGLTFPDGFHVQIKAKGC